MKCEVECESEEKQSGVTALSLFIPTLRDSLLALSSSKGHSVLVGQRSEISNFYNDLKEVIEV
jgi:hypothetical protein